LVSPPTIHVFLCAFVFAHHHHLSKAHASKCGATHM
jgi:hypothetical protein